MASNIVKPEWKEPNLSSIPKFAKLKDVSRQSVYGAISSGYILPTLIGMDKDMYIDLTKYKDFEFKPAYGRKRKIREIKTV
jgi:hypothetical protein